MQYSILPLPWEAALQPPLNIRVPPRISFALYVPCTLALHAVRYATVSCLVEIASADMVLPVSRVTGTTALDNLGKIQNNSSHLRLLRGRHHGQAHSCRTPQGPQRCMTCRAAQSSLDLAWEACVIRTGLCRGSLQFCKSSKISRVAPFFRGDERRDCSGRHCRKLTTLALDAIW